MEKMLDGKHVFLTGGSRGIGLCIAKACARAGADLTIVGKTADSNPTLPGTLFDAAEAIKAEGAECLPIILDIRDDDKVAAAVEQSAERFGRIDALINNASAIRMTPTLDTPLKRYDLMHGVNGRGTFAVTQAALPHLLKADNPHVISIAPPLTLNAKWFAPHPPYSISKFTMSLFTHAWAMEFEGRVAFNALWPRTAIATAAVKNEIGGQDMMTASRRPEIVADAALEILKLPADQWSGNFFLDDEILIAAGKRDLAQYDVTPGAPLQTDFFLEQLPGMIELRDEVLP